jgi:hypothetical protein
MAQKPRISISLDDANYQILKRVSKLSRQSVGAIVNNVLSGSNKSLTLLCDTLEASQKQQIDLPELEKSLLGVLDSKKEEIQESLNLEK